MKVGLACGRYGTRWLACDSGAFGAYPALRHNERKLSLHLDGAAERRRPAVRSVRQGVIALYFNFTSQIANDWWGRRAFLNTWWRANARDHRWTPPVYSFLESTLVHRRDPLMNTYRPDLLAVEAVTRQSFSTNIGGMVMPTGMGDSIVAQALALHDRRVDPATTFLAMMAFANDEETLDRLLDSTWQSAATHGAQRIVAPAQWAPSFSSGLLLDHFHVLPPLHTPYNAPFVPELMQGAMEPLQHSLLWYLEVAHAPTASALPQGVQIESFDVDRLAGDLLPLAQAAAVTAAVLEPPTVDEVRFALRMWTALAIGAPLAGRLVTVDGAPIAFYVTQADVGAMLRRLRGGRPLWARSLLALRPRFHRHWRSVEGRVLLAACMPHADERSVAQAMIDDLGARARGMGWRTLTIGPLPEGAAIAQVLANAGAIARQRYALFVQET